MDRRVLAVLGALALVGTAGCLGFFGGGGGGDDSLVVDAADGATYVEGGDGLPAGTAIEVSVAGDDGDGRIVTLSESVGADTRVYLAGGDGLQASVGERPSATGETCDLTVAVDTGDRTATRDVTGVDCLGLLDDGEPAASGPAVEIASEPVGNDTQGEYVYVRPTDGTTLSPETRLNVTLEVTINNGTQRDTLETTLGQSVSSGTTVYLADEGGELSVVVGAVDDSVTVVRPEELPAPLRMTVAVTDGGTTSETLVFGDDGDDGSG